MRFGKPRTGWLRVRLTPEEMEVLRHQAKTRGFNVSDYVRFKLGFTPLMYSRVPQTSRVGLEPARRLERCGKTWRRRLTRSF